MSLRELITLARSVSEEDGGVENTVAVGGTMSLNFTGSAVAVASVLLESAHFAPGAAARRRNEGTKELAKARLGAMVLMVGHELKQYTGSNQMQ